MLTFSNIGDRLSSLLSTAEMQVVLAAPFIKTSVIDSLFRMISASVEVDIFTRWRTAELAAGVSDLDVFDVVRRRPKARLFLVSDLHAKYYRADEDCLVGSANLTMKALGWCSAPNIEVVLRASRSKCEAFESHLRTVCWEPDSTYRDQQEGILAQFSVESFEWAEWSFSSELLSVNGGLEDELRLQLGIQGTPWLPFSRYPENILLGYGGYWDQLTSAGQQQVRADLRALDLPPGCTDDRVKELIAVRLLANPLVERIESLLALRPQRFGTIRGVCGEWLRENEVDRDPADVWQTLMRWLLFVRPSRYTCSVPGKYSEVFGLIAE